MVVTRGACFRCRLPSFSRALLIPKGRQSLFHLAVQDEVALGRGKQPADLAPLS